MAKKQTPDTKPATPKSQSASAGLKARLKEKNINETYQPNDTERVARSYIDRRSGDMQDYRKGLGIEVRWREADEEYIPHELDFGTTRKRFETDQDTGLRSRMVPVGDVTQQWRQASSAPTLLAKIQTALCIIIDNQPEAELVALLKRYSATTDLAYAMWKRNWQVTNAKEKLKLLAFDNFKYGWCIQRTYPRLVKYPKRILVEVDPENPENDKYIEKDIVWFNDVDRQRLDPFRTWIDELAQPYDPYSTNECYYEMDYSYDSFMTEFGKYPNSKFVKRDSQFIREDIPKKSNRTAANQELRRRKDIVTVGFFESRHKDMYAIYIPSDKIVLYLSPLPNDDGYLSLTHTLNILRKSSMPYGVSLWEIIRQNKQLYDKMKNMSMDQLVLSIMKFGFFSGTNTAIGDGKMEIVPGEARQITTSNGDAGKAVNWMEIPGPGAESWKGLEVIDEMMDQESGITAPLESEITGKTLGEIQMAREAALKRMKAPLENIAWLIEQDAYLTLSWMSQIYTIPTIQTFTDEKELQAYEKESEVTNVQLFGTPQADGTIGGPFEAHYLPELSLHLEDNDGKLSQSKNSKFFQVGKDIMPNQLKWKGIFKVIPRSILDSSQSVVKAVKSEVFNMIMPLLKFPPELVARGCAQMIKIVEEDPKDWLPDAFLQFLEGSSGQASPGGQVFNASGTEGAPEGAGMPPEAPQPPNPMQMTEPGTSAPPAQPQSVQAGAGTAPMSGQKVVAGNQGPSISQLAGKSSGLFNKKL